jgi:hypothetical protein
VGDDKIKAGKFYPSGTTNPFHTADCGCCRAVAGARVAKHRCLLPVAMLSVLFAFASCAPPAGVDDKTQTRLREVEKQIEEQRAAAARFEKATSESVEKAVTAMGDSLAEQFNKLVMNVTIEVGTVKRSLYLDKTAILDPTSKGYSSVTTDKGIFLFAVDGAEPFLDGHKISLRVGNPMNMTFSGFTLKIRFGKRPPAFPSLSQYTGDLRATNIMAEMQKWQTDRQTWEKTLRNSDVAFTERLEPGAWNKVDCILKETKPEDVAYMEVGIETSQVALRMPQD